MADLAFLEAKIVCGGAWSNDKMVWGFWGLGEVVGRRCSALLVLGLGEVRGFGWGFFGAIAFLGALGATRSTRIF